MPRWLFTFSLYDMEVPKPTGGAEISVQHSSPPKTMGVLPTPLPQLGSNQEPGCAL